jgi:hypothetical protein
MFAAPCYAAIYKWVDEDGKVHYSETRPAEHQSKKMHVPMRTPENTSTYKRPSLKTDKDAEAKDGAAGEDTKQAADSGMSSEEKAKICDRARAVLQTLTAGDRVRQKDQEGNITYMTEEEKQKRITSEKGKISKYCN